MSDIDENGKMYVVAQNGTGAGKHFSLDELPSGTTKGTILRYKNGKFVIDEELTKKSIDEDNRAKLANKKLLAEYKTECVDYLVTEIGDDYVMLKNQQTGLEFDSYDFSEDVFKNLHEGTMLTCKNGEYVLKKVIIFTIIILLCIFVGLVSYFQNKPSININEDILRIYYFDVGQADCTFF